MASADGLATQAGLTALARGGNAVDAAIATNAAIAVTAPHLCGMGGDLFALVHDPAPPSVALNASGRAGSGADAAALRAEGHTRDAVPPRHPNRHRARLRRRVGRAPRALRPAPAGRRARARHRAGRGRLPGVAAPRRLAGARSTSRRRVAARRARSTGRRARATVSAGRRGPGAARHRRGRTGRASTRASSATDCSASAAGYFTADDLGRSPARLGRRRWRCDAFGVTGSGPMPPNSQGYLALGRRRGSPSGSPLPDDPDDPRWAHLLIEAADGRRSRPARRAPRRRRRRRPASPDAHRPASRRQIHRIDIDSVATRAGADGDTTYLCAVDGERMGVSLIQSNAAGFGAWLVEPNTGINLHNRGLGFSLEPGHPAELGPGRRPPHTLRPRMATHADGSLRRRLRHDGRRRPAADPAAARGPPVPPRPAVRPRPSPAGRWVLHGPATGFDTWTVGERPGVAGRGPRPARLGPGLRDRGHRVDARRRLRQRLRARPRHRRRATTACSPAAADPHGSAASAESAAGT